MIYKSRPTYIQLNCITIHWSARQLKMLVLKTRYIIWPYPTKSSIVTWWISSFIGIGNRTFQCLEQFNQNKYFMIHILWKKCLCILFYKVHHLSLQCIYHNLYNNLTYFQQTKSLLLCSAIAVRNYFGNKLAFSLVILETNNLR